MYGSIARCGVLVALLAVAACGGGGGGGGGGSTSYTIGGSISGLGGTVVLQNGGTSLTRSTNGAFSFGTQVAAGATYQVTVQTQPQDQTCTVTNGQGTANSNVNNVTVTCVTNLVKVGGTVTGLSGTMVLVNGQQETLAVRTTDAGHPAFSFPESIASGTTYAITVMQQPAGQECTVTNGSGTAHGNVSNVTVACVGNTTTIGGTVSGLTGAGLVLHNLLTDNLAIAPAGGVDVPFTFPAAIKAGNAYAVTVAAQPAGQTCLVTANGSGTANGNVTNVGVTCTAIPTNVMVGGMVTGLAGTMQLRISHSLGGAGTNTDVAVNSNGNIPFASIPGGSAFTVGVLVQPAGQTCIVYNFAGVATTDVSNARIECSNGTTTYAVGGSATGVTQSGLVLAMDIGGFIGVAANASGPSVFTFARRLPSDTEFRLGIFQQPAGLTCVLPVTTGRVVASDITSIAVTCVPNDTDPLVGIYKMPGGVGYLSFQPDGQYALASHQNTPLPPSPDSCGPSRGNGVELGVYNYNATNGTLTIVANMVDTNGGCGLWDNGPPDVFTLQKSGVGQGSVLTATVGTDSYTLTPALSSPDGLVGAYRVPFAPTFIVLDGTRYVLGDFGDGTRGIEYGCYTANGTTLTATVVTATCPGAVDGNDDGGLADGGTGEPIPYALAPGLLSIGTPPIEGVVTVRVVPN